ncbi:MAG: methyl-accepting chemotaxis protein [Psychrobium sp.]
MTAQSSTLNFNILTRLAAVAVVACVGLAAILITSFRSDTIKQVEQLSNENIQRAAQMFMVSTVRFNEEFTKETDPVKKAEIHQDWIKTIEAVDLAVTHDFGSDVAQIRLFTDEQKLNLTSFGKDITATKTPFEANAISTFARGKLNPIVIQDSEFYKIAVPLMSNMHPGCANCHSIPVSDAKVLGGLSVVTPIAAKMAASNSLAVKLSLATFIVLALVSAFIYFFLYNNVSNPISRLTRNTTSLASDLQGGTLSSWQVKTEKYEINQLSSGISTLHSALETLLNDVRNQAAIVEQHSVSTSTIAKEAESNIFSQQANLDGISQAITELMNVSEDVSQRANHTATITSEVTQGITDSGENMQQTLQQINALADNITRANEVVNQLSAQSDSIGGIISTIDGIAEQTNLLALNAAIEAARAGEQGRGFAVVADEVRTLAQRTQEATSEINDLVQGLQKGANQASDVMNESRDQAMLTVDNAVSASELLNNVTQQVETINGLNSDNATAATQQSSTIGQLRENIDEITGKSHAILEGAQTTVQQSQHLSEISSKLGNLIKIK